MFVLRGQRGHVYYYHQLHDLTTSCQESAGLDPEGAGKRLLSLSLQAGVVHLYTMYGGRAYPTCNLPGMVQYFISDTIFLTSCGTRILSPMASNHSHWRYRTDLAAKKDSIPANSSQKMRQNRPGPHVHPAAISTWLTATGGHGYFCVAFSCAFHPSNDSSGYRVQEVLLGWFCLAMVSSCCMSCSWAG